MTFALRMLKDSNQYLNKAEIFQICHRFRPVLLSNSKQHAQQICFVSEVYIMIVYSVTI